MCGIAGIISPNTALVQPLQVQQMMQTLQHRGPDGEGIFINVNKTVCLGHRRLAIIDTTDKGQQPMHYLHYSIVFNGEIYNYLELKQTLQSFGYTFYTATDTEVIVAAFDYWKNECLEHFDGMFAFVIIDKQTDAIFIARDRFGEKPLYYFVEYLQKAVFNKVVFASEMKALWAIGLPKQVNGTMLLNYITLGYLQNPLKATQTFYNNILSLPAGHFLTIQPQIGKIVLKRWYWFKPNTTINVSNTSTVIEAFQSLFSTSINRRLRSDVAIGTSLSGGIDSSAIAATILQNKALQLNTFSAIFPGFKNDESQYIKAFQQHFATDRIVPFFVSPSADDLHGLLKKLQYHQEEPMQSSSVFTQYMVYELAAKQGVKVLLDGQGADEILGGYTKYTPWYLQQILRNNCSVFVKEKKLLTQNNFLVDWNIKNYAAAFLPEQTAKQLQQKAIQQQQHHQNINTDYYTKFVNKDTLQKPVVNCVEDLLYYNTFIHGLQELLRYADRNSMANSVEVRLPFLQHQLVEFIFSLTSNYKIQHGFTKWILRKASENMLPSSIAWRKGKIGYEPPQQLWMQQKYMQDVVMDAREKLVDKQILNKAILQTPFQAKAAHASNNFDWQYINAAAIL